MKKLRCVAEVKPTVSGPATGSQEWIPIAVLCRAQRWDGLTGVTPSGSGSRWVNRLDHAERTRTDDYTWQTRVASASCAAGR